MRLKAQTILQEFAYYGIIGCDKVGRNHDQKRCASDARGVPNVRSACFSRTPSVSCPKRAVALWKILWNSWAWHLFGEFRGISHLAGRIGCGARFPCVSEDTDRIVAAKKRH